MPPQPEPQLASGLVVMTNANRVTALSPATGRTRWTVTTASPIDSVTSGPSGIAVSTEFPSRLLLIDPKTGRVRWRVAYQGGQAPPLDTGTDLLYQGGEAVQPDRPACRQRVGALGRASPVTSFAQILRIGAYAVVVGNVTKPDSPALVTAYRLSTGKQAWTTKVPTFVEVPAAVAGANLLVQSGDVTDACPA